MDEALNVGFFAFHTAWIAFNCLGWLWRPTRRLHLATLLVTALSWFGLGAWYGWGYCPCTDWHWQIRERLGYNDPPSYTQLLIREVVRFDPGSRWADGLTLIVFLAAVTMSIVFNLRDRRSTRR